MDQNQQVQGEQMPIQQVPVAGGQQFVQAAPQQFAQGRNMAGAAVMQQPQMPMQQMGVMPVQQMQQVQEPVEEDYDSLPDSTKKSSFVGVFIIPLLFIGILGGGVFFASTMFGNTGEALTFETIENHSVETVTVDALPAVTAPVEEVTESDEVAGEAEDSALTEGAKDETEAASEATPEKAPVVRR